LWIRLLRPKEAVPESLHRFSVDKTDNGLHSSDSPTTATQEISILCGRFDFFEHNRPRWKLLKSDRINWKSSWKSTEKQPETFNWKSSWKSTGKATGIEYLFTPGVPHKFFERFIYPWCSPAQIFEQFIYHGNRKSLE